jgi:3',5'-cyclic-nucleotide phosphodiesterase
MFDRVDCAGLYLDDRVRSERWVRRNSIDELTISSTGSFTTPDEPDALQADVERLLEVCKQGRFRSLRCV